MSSGITMSNLNGIDWTVVLDALMAQEQKPVTTLQTQQKALQAKSSAYATLGTKLSALKEASDDLRKSSTFSGRGVSSTNGSIVTATTTSTASAGTYDVVVQELARAQVTTSTSLADDKDKTTVATGGKIVIGGKEVTLKGNVTLQGLADAINANGTTGVQATVVSPSSGKFQLVLTGTNTGIANAFTIDTRGLTGSTVTFGDADSDGLSGDDTADNKTSALDARILLNNVTVTSTTNTIEDAIPGTKLTLLRKSSDTVGVSITKTSEATTSALNTFVSAYNALTSYVTAQTGADGDLTRDPLLRGLKADLRDVMLDQHAVGNSVTSLAAVGLGFAQDGTVKFDSTVWDDVIESKEADVKRLFMGTTTQTGVFKLMTETIQKYTDAGALIANARDRITEQIAAMDTRLANMQERLAQRKLSLQQEMIAADQTISQLKNQSGALSSLSS
jgi:flagellar hook-associated protein 2